MLFNLDHQWIKTTLNNGHILIAGPCSAESKQQLTSIAQILSNSLNLTYMRAGIWKPRTRPNCFEGIGLPALKWLQEIKNDFKIKVTTEVASSNHVELALEHNIDALWIGARTSTNPFAVEDIASALDGIDIPVFVKNPINPDISLWLGAIERLQNHGITKLMAIHRGFSTYGQSRFRNDPMWKIPMELKRLAPELPLLCDPSHIGGKRTLLSSLSQKAYDLGFDGLMIETHPNPDEALSDAAQQLTPHDLQSLISSLTDKKQNINDLSVIEKIEHQRELVDEVDEKIMVLLKERENIVQKIGELKRDNNITAFQVRRLDALLKMRSAYAQEIGLEVNFIQEIFNSIHAESVRFQTNMIEQTKSTNT